MKIGVFGGCFNPPHKKHKTIVLDLMAKGYVDKIVYVPTENSYNKEDLTIINHRINMLHLMIQNNPNIEVLQIQNDETCKYTYQVLDKLKEIYPNDELYFICGEDNLSELETWKKFTYILKNYKILAIKRGNMNTKKIIEKYYPFEKNIIIANIDSESISSTMIRNLIKENKEKEILKYLDENVYNYIIKEKLYINKES